MISLERTACLGTCPVYTVQVDESGIVRYQGEMHVATHGTRMAKIPLADVMSLMNELLEAGFMEMTWGCPQLSTCSSTAITIMRIDGREKVTRHYYGCEGDEVLEVLTKLEARIDEVLGTATWIEPLLF